MSFSNHMADVAAAVLACAAIAVFSTSSRTLDAAELAAVLVVSVLLAAVKSQCQGRHGRPCGAAVDAFDVARRRARSLRAASRGDVVGKMSDSTITQRRLSDWKMSDCGR